MRSCAKRDTSRGMFGGKVELVATGFLAGKPLLQVAYKGSWLILNVRCARRVDLRLVSSPAADPEQATDQPSEPEQLPPGT